MTALSLSDWLARLEQLHPAPMALGLDRISQVYQRLNLNFAKTTVITVAGTNGKGSVVTLLQNALLSAGHRVGAYTSPHLQRYNERICVNGETLSDAEIVHSFERVEAHRDNVALTYFEFGTLAALEHFSRQPLDYLVLEVGLGGRLDAVNILAPQLTIVTSIDLDHQAWLGDDRELIGAEKAGIFRLGVPVICGDIAPPASLLQRAQDLACPLYLYGRDYSLAHNEKGIVWQGRGATCDTCELELAVRPVLLDSNVATALQALMLLPAVGEFDPAVLAGGVPGRQERIEYEGIEILLDVSHNPAAARALAAHLQSLVPVERCVALFGVMADKDIAGMVEPLKGCFEAWFLGDLRDNPRAKPARDLAALLHGQGIHMISVSKNMRQAFARAISLLEPGHRLVVFGSVYTVAEIKTLLDRKQSKGEC